MIFILFHLCIQSLEQIIKLGETILMNESKVINPDIPEEYSFITAAATGKSPASRQMRSPAREPKANANYSINRRLYEKINLTQNFSADSPNESTTNSPSQEAMLLGDDVRTRVRNENRMRVSTPGTSTVTYTLIIL